MQTNPTGQTAQDVEEIESQSPQKYDLDKIFESVVTAVPQEDYEAANGAVIPTRLFDQMGAVMSMSVDSSTLGSILRSKELSNASDNAEKANERKLSPKQLAEMFPAVGNNFVEPLAPSVAKIISDRYEKNAERQRLVEAAPDDTFNNVVSFGASLMPHFLDPINLAADLVTAGTMRAAILGLKMGKTAKMLGLADKVIDTHTGRSVMKAIDNPSAVKVLARESVEGIIGNTLVEPIGIMADENELRDRAAMESLLNIAVGGVAFPAAMYGLKGVSNGGGKFFNYVRRRGAQAELSYHMVHQNQIMNGQHPNSEPINIHMAKEIDGTVNAKTGKMNVDTQKDFIPIRSEDLPMTPLYSVAIYRGVDSELGDFYQMGAPLGSGKTFTTKAQEAHAYAIGDFADGNGQIFESRVAGNFLDLSQRPPKSLFEFVKSNVSKEVKSLLDKMDIDKMDGLEIFDVVRQAIHKGDLPESALDEIGGALSKQGFSGYHYIGAQVGDVSISPRSYVHVFPDHLKSESRLRNIDPDESQTGKVTKSDLDSIKKKSEDPKNDMFYDKDSAAREREIVDNPDKDLTEDEIILRMDKKLNDMLVRQEAGEVSPRSKKLMEEAKQQKMLIEKEQQLVDELGGCVSG